jgi:lactate permease
MWQHNYEPLSGSLGGSAIIAALPIVVLFLMLGVFRRPTWMSALSALATAFIVALAVYGMPANLALVSIVYGAAFGLFPIAWIVFAAIMLYRLAVDTGKFEIIKDSVGGLSSDRRLQAMFIAFSFGAFIEGAAGFGAPVAVSGAMLAGLGFNPFFAAGICLLANTAPVAFGSIGIPVTTLANITGLPVMALSQMVGRLCAMISLFIPGYLIVVMAGGRRAMEVLPAIIACGLSFAAMQFTVSNFIGPELTDIASSLTCIAVMVLVMKVWTPRNVMHLEGDGPATIPSWTPGHGVAVQSHGSVAVVARKHTGAEVFTAWLPYLLLVAFVLVWGEADIKAALNRWTNSLLPSGIPRSATLLNGLLVPGLHNMIQRVPPVVAQPSPYAAVFEFNWLSASGTSCFLATIAAAILLRVSPGAVRQDLRGHVQAARAADADDRHDAGAGVSDELFRDDVDARTRAGGHWTGISILQRGPRLARRVSHRQRYVGQRPLRQSPGRHRERAASEPRTHGRRQFGRRCDGEDDFDSKHRGSGRRDGHDACG